jgi:glycerate 2-kinase
MTLRPKWVRKELRIWIWSQNSIFVNHPAHMMQLALFRTMNDQKQLLERIFSAAVAAAHPSQFLPTSLPEPPEQGRLIILAAGKAAGSMIQCAENYYLNDQGFPAARLSGHAVARTGYGAPTQLIPMVEAGHPVPDAAGVAAAREALALAHAATVDDLVLVLLSGGASANWIAPAGGLTLEMKQAITKALLRSGAVIGEINTVRKHLSLIKGGRLAIAAWPARIVTLGVSDVPGDEPTAIGSGPTVPDPTTLADARAIIARYSIPLPPEAKALLGDAGNETPKPGHAAFAGSEMHIVARPADAIAAAATIARQAGYETVLLGSDLEGEARDVAAAQARLALEIQAAGKKAAIISGGELTVTLKGAAAYRPASGSQASAAPARGGPNQEFALALALALDGRPGIWALAGDTDGTDGGAGSASDPAGAMIDPGTLARATARGLDARAFLARNDSTGFFEALGDLLTPGPTLTNVNDCRVILIEPSS